MNASCNAILYCISSCAIRNECIIYCICIAFQCLHSKWMHYVLHFGFIFHRVHSKWMHHVLHFCIAFHRVHSKWKHHCIGHGTNSMAKSRLASLSPPQPTSFCSLTTPSPPFSCAKYNLLCLAQNWSKEPPPPWGGFLVPCSLTKNPEEEDPPQRICTRCFELGLLCSYCLAQSASLTMGWLQLIGSLKLYVTFAKEPYKRDYILQKRPIILRSLPIEATPYVLRKTSCPYLVSHTK